MDGTKDVTRRLDWLTLKPSDKFMGDPLRRRKPTLWFVNSMSDLFHDGVPFEYVDEVFAVMIVAGQHTYQVLTKRADRMREYMDRAGYVEGRAKRLMRERGMAVPQGKTLAWPPPNVWLGVSVENRKHGVPRIDELRAVPAAVRFLSCEPLLEDLGHLDLTGIDWVIVGGESGPGARPMHPDWARSIRDQVLALRKPCHACGGVGRFPGCPIPPDMTLAACAECESTRYYGPALFVKQGSGRLSGRQYDLPDDLWQYKEMPRAQRQA